VIEWLWLNLWLLALVAAWFVLLGFAKNHQNHDLALSSAISSGYIMCMALLSLLSHEPQGHVDDAGYDLEWAWFIGLDLVFLFVLWRFGAPSLTLGLLVISVAYQVIRLYLEPNSEAEEFLEGMYQPYLFLIYLILFVWSMRATISSGDISESLRR